jgi:hypothetical protein
MAGGRNDDNDGDDDDDDDDDDDRSARSMFYMPNFTYIWRCM